MEESKQSTIKLSAQTKARLKHIADVRGRKESYEQVILELIDNSMAYKRIMMQAEQNNGK